MRSGTPYLVLYFPGYAESKNAEIQSTLHKYFRMLLDRKISRNPSRSRTSVKTDRSAVSDSSFHLDTETLDTDFLPDPLLDSALTNIGDPESGDNPVESKVKDFRTSTLGYITESDEFLDYLKAIDATHARPGSQRDSYLDFSSGEETMLDLSQDLFASQSKKPKHRHSHRNETVTNSTETYSGYTEQYPELQDMFKDLPQSFRSYTIYKETTLDRLQGQTTYCWLLDLCSQHVGGRAQILHTVIQNLEKGFLGSQRDHRTKASNLRRHFQSCGVVSSKLESLLQS